MLIKRKSLSQELAMVIKAGRRVVRSKVEQVAAPKMLTMTDGSSIRVLQLSAPETTQDVLTILLIGGWGSVVDDLWDNFALETAKYFDVILLETREKNSSILRTAAKHDLNRISDDVKEVLSILNIDESRLVIHAFSWGSIVAAHGLANRKFLPLLTVFICPLGKLTLPPLTRHIIPFMPIYLLSLCKPLAKLWLINFKYGNPSHAAGSLKVLNEADIAKWKTVGKYLTSSTFWYLYPKIGSNVLIIYSKNDKFHEIAETKKIIKLVQNSVNIEITEDPKNAPELIVELIKKQIDAKHPRR